MSFVIATPELMTAAATDLANIGTTLTTANAAAATQTTGVLAAAEDEVSAAIAAVFSAHGQAFQALSAQAAAFHEQFVQALTAGARSYLGTEAANASAVTALGGGSGGILQTVGNALLSEVVGSIPGLHEAELALDVAGPVVVALPVLEHQTAFISALQTGNLGALTAALRNPAVVQAFLHGQDTVAVPLSLPGVSVTLDVPFGGVLAPLQPISATVAIAGNPPVTFAIPGTDVGGIVPALPGLLLGGGLLGGWATYADRLNRVTDWIAATAALTAAEDAVAREQLPELRSESDLTGILKRSEVSRSGEVEHGPFTPPEGLSTPPRAR